MFVVNRDAHHSNYTCIANAVLRDTRLSLAARGFMAVVLSLPDDWEFSVRGMAVYCGVSEGAIRRSLRELIDVGYVSATRLKENGRIISGEYVFNEMLNEEELPSVQTRTTDFFASKIPHEEIPHEEIPHEEIPHEEIPHEEIPHEEIPHEEIPHEEIPHEEIPHEEIPHEGNAPQLNTNKPNTETKQSTDLTKPRGGAEEVERQIEADALRAEFGRECIDGAVRVISGALKAKQRTYSGVAVDNAELRRVFGAAGAEDVRAALRAIEGNNYSSFGGYFGAVLFRMVRDRLDCPRVQHEREFSASSIDVDEVMESILAKYRDVGS